MTNEQIASMKALSAEAEALQKSPRIATEEGRELLNLLRRVIETLETGAPVTKPLARHHA